MKEYDYTQGGRNTYVDDITNLQELALSMSSIFEGCGNFIISGCELSSSGISSGFVYLNGKVRKFSGTSHVAKFPVYLSEYNTIEKVPYADSVEKNGRKSYQCVALTEAPVTPDIVTQQTPQYIQVQSDGSARRIRDAFFGKYNVLLEANGETQNVNGSLVFTGNVQSNKRLVGSELSVAGAIIGKNDSGEFELQSSNSSGIASKLTVNSDGYFVFYRNNQRIAEISENGLRLVGGINLPSLQSGNIKTIDNSIYNSSVSDNSGEVRINMLGFEGSNTYFRNTTIGDGKGKELLKVVGSKGQVEVIATINASNNIVLSDNNHSKNSQDYNRTIQWKDNSQSTMTTLGYSEGGSNFIIDCKTGDVIVKGNLRVMGKLLSQQQESNRVIEVSRPIVKDTGWVLVEHQNESSSGTYSSTIKARQYGASVTITGTIGFSNPFAAAQMTLPNSIDPPPVDIDQVYSNYFSFDGTSTKTLGVRVQIEKGSRNMVVTKVFDHFQNAAGNGKLSMNVIYTV